MKITTSKMSGFTLVEIMVVVAIIGLLAALAIPNLIRARSTSQQNVCVNNLRLIEAAKSQLLTMYGEGADLAKANVQKWIGRTANGTFPTCPTTGTDSYAVNDKDTLPTCSNSTTEYPHVLVP